MIDLVELKKRIEFHLDDRDAAEYTGNILPDSLEAIEELEAELKRFRTANAMLSHLLEMATNKKRIEKLWEENIRRREAIENHAHAMEEEGIKTYYFDRELHAVVGIEERPKRWR